MPRHPNAPLKLWHVRNRNRCHAIKCAFVHANHPVAEKKIRSNHHQNVLLQLTVYRQHLSVALPLWHVKCQNQRNYASVHVAFRSADQIHCIIQAKVVDKELDVHQLYPSVVLNTSMELKNKIFVCAEHHTLDEFCILSLNYHQFLWFFLPDLFVLMRKHSTLEMLL